MQFGILMWPQHQGKRYMWDPAGPFPVKITYHWSARVWFLNQHDVYLVRLSLLVWVSPCWVKPQCGQAFWREDHTVVSEEASGLLVLRLVWCCRQIASGYPQLTWLPSSVYEAGFVSLSLSSCVGDRSQSWKSELFTLIYIRASGWNFTGIQVITKALMRFRGGTVVQSSALMANPAWPWPWPWPHSLTRRAATEQNEGRRRSWRLMSLWF